MKHFGNKQMIESSIDQTARPKTYKAAMTTSTPKMFLKICLPSDQCVYLGSVCQSSNSKIFNK